MSAERRPVIEPRAIAGRLAGLDSIGVGDGGVWRLAWTEEAASCRQWFCEQARDTGLTVNDDPAGNLWACPADDPPWIGIGSHLDSVRGGGRFDGPLGVACGFEITRHSRRPVAVISFADEEGSRFNTPTFGSKALAGRLQLPDVLDRRDDDGVSLGEAMSTAGVDPRGLERAPQWLERLTAFIEIHIDQTTDLARAGAPVGIVRSLAPRRRLEVELIGQADHAGTTPRAERRDALAAAARMIVAADELGAEEELAVTTARIEVEPNAPTTIAARARIWIDARGQGIDARGEGIDRWQRRLEQLAAELPVDVTLTVASRSDAVSFDERLRARLARTAQRLLGAPAPELVCFAGHDAGVVAERIPAGMVFVRNETGVSHSPEEHVEIEDAAVAAQVVAEALDD